MTPPDNTPPKWLEASDEGWAEKGEGFKLAGDPTDEKSPNSLIVTAVEYGHDSAEKTLPEWLAWRSRVAEALGLAEPSKNRTGVCPSAAIDVAVAAELRKQAAEMGRARAEWNDALCLGAAIDRLRARAAELDPPTGSSR